MKKKEVNLKGTVELKQAVAHLECLVASLKAGKVCVQNCNDHVTLVPDGPVKLEVAASQRESKETFTLKLAWSKAEPAAHTLELRISAEEPPAHAATSDGAEDAVAASTHAEGL